MVDLRERMTGLAPELALRALTWAADCLMRQPASWRAGLQAVKNSAYAWRQGIYFLSLCEESVQAHVIGEIRHLLQAANGDLQVRLAPAVEGLAHVIACGHFDGAGMTAGGSGRRFLGWTTGRHWLSAGDTY